MKKRFYFNILLIVIVLIVVIVGLVATIKSTTDYRDIYRLSPYQVQNSLSEKVSSCKKISECELVPGDILIRRYITERTWLIDILANPYFTHSALYLGNNQIVEAIGYEKNPNDDIQIETLSETDWLNPDISKWIIIRPQKISPIFKVIDNNLRNIAFDPNYVFGLPKDGYKRTTCADLIFKQLYDNGLITTSNIPEIITPRLSILGDRKRFK